MLLTSDRPFTPPVFWQGDARQLQVGWPASSLVPPQLTNLASVSTKGASTAPTIGYTLGLEPPKLTWSAMYPLIRQHCLHNPCHCRLLLPFLSPGGHMVGPFEGMFLRAEVGPSGAYDVHPLAPVAFAELLTGDKGRQGGRGRWCYGQLIGSVVQRLCFSKLGCRHRCRRCVARRTASNWTALACRL